MISWALSKIRLGLRRCLLENAFEDRKIVRREAAKNDLTDGCQLAGRRQNRGYRDPCRKVDRVAIDAGADARESEREKFIFCRQFQAAPIARGQEFCLATRASSPN